MTPTQKAAMEQMLAALEHSHANEPIWKTPHRDAIAAGRAALAETAEPVHQYRNPHSADWYDGIPDHHDGHGPYEVRTLYTQPPAPASGAISYDQWAELPYTKVLLESINSLTAKLQTRPPAPAVECDCEELPPLPETNTVPRDYFTADQMREFARAAIAAHEAKKAPAAREVSQQEVGVLRRAAMRSAKMVKAPTAEPVACKHGWFRTGAMAPGEMRCIHCGQWGKAPTAPAVECDCDELLAALKFYLAAWDGGDVSWFKNCYAVVDKARAAIAAHQKKGQP